MPHERTLRPRLEGSDRDLFEALDRERDVLREAMDDIHQRTMGIDPRNVHASDGQGFEDTLTIVVLVYGRSSGSSTGRSRPSSNPRGVSQRRELADEVAHAYQNASERPWPPRTAVGRFLRTR